MNKNFVLLFQGQLVSAAGSQIVYVGIMLWVLDITGSATTMGLLMMASMIPAVLLGPIGGTFADRCSRKRIIVLSDFLMGLATAGFAALLFFVEGAINTKLTVLFCLAVFGGIVNSFFFPSVSAALPDLVPRQSLTGANSLMQSSRQIASFVGQGLGGVLYRLGGASLLYLIDGISYLFSSASEMFIEIPKQPEKEKIRLGNVLKIFKDETLEGLRYILRNPGVRAVVLIAAFLNFFIGPIFVLMPIFVKDFLHAKPDWYGFILAGLGVGALIGYIIAGTVRRVGATRAITHVIVLVAFSAGFLGLGFVRSAPLCLALMMAIGLLVGILQVDLNTILQMGVPADIRGRVFGFLGTLSGGLMPIAMGLSGVISDAIGGNVPAIYITCGILLVFISILAAFSRGYREFLSTE